MLGLLGRSCSLLISFCSQSFNCMPSLSQHSPEKWRRRGERRHSLQGRCGAHQLDAEVNVHRSSHTFIYCSIVQEINKINERDLELGVGTASWHDKYQGRTGTDTISLFRAHDPSDSAHIFIEGLYYGLTEGDIISIFSQ